VTDPLALLPLAAAARGGSVDGIAAQALAAAGITLLQRSAPLVRALAGKRSALLLPTSPAFFVALAASEGRGAVLMNPLAAPRELAYQIGDADVGAVFTIAVLADRLPDGIVRVLLDDAPRTATVIAAGTSRTIDLGSHFPLELEGDPDATGDSSEAAIVYTSAMLGRPLGAILTHRGLLANARATIEAGAVRGSERVLAALPFSHLFGFVVTGVAPLLAGSEVVTMPRYHPLRVIETIEQREISMFVGVPSMYASLLAAIGRRGGAFDAGSLRLCLCGGAPLDPRVQDRWFAATGIELRQGYGLTEASPVVLFNQPSAPNVRGTLGTPYPGVEVAIRDLETFAAVPDGTTGEICARGITVFAGYLGDPESTGTRGLEIRDRWLRTGDLGHRRHDGVFVFDGVAKSMFTRNGFNVYPREIESAVAELPGVTSASVTAIPDPLHENDIGLTVIGSVTEDEIRAWCEERLSVYKQPSSIAVVATR
jgi:long-chain acyl-CoA synthetase